MAATEPSAEQFTEMQGFADLFQWAWIAGDLTYPTSMAGSLLVLVGGEPDMSIVEYAGLSNNDVEEMMKEWYYSASPVDDGSGADNMTIRASPVVKSNARSSLRAARIWAGVEY